MQRWPPGQMGQAVWRSAGAGYRRSGSCCLRPAAGHRAQLARSRNPKRGNSVLCRNQVSTSGCSPTWRPCPTTASPPTPTSPLRGLRRWPNCRARAAACGWSPSIPCCSDWRPRSYIEAYSLQVHLNETLDLEALRAQLAMAGYAAVTQVVAHGEFAVRGSLIDVFPMGSDTPYRIDLLDRDVDSIRRFDPETQRSLDKLDRIHLLPARETPLEPEAVREFRRRYRLRFTRRPCGAGGLPRHQRRHCARRDRVLPAAVLRAHLASVRVFAAQQRRAGHQRCGLERERTVERDRGAPRTAAARPLPPDLGSGRGLSDARRISAGAGAVAARLNCAPSNGPRRPRDGSKIFRPRCPPWCASMRAPSSRPPNWRRISRAPRRAS